ncbi:hypothetical protein SAMN06295885_0072 [Rathayibacter oskolensis]|uniref:Uncharacterized protein n=1 Tax=Rathayibacter oskolensis TaxID=1891671 RepID=A0A1X7MSY3_9MICO|nr:hypothetical protein [Rathayibacter oskolensis]SMH27922.1 hypothetical protein SAMN06295885_0072 [Rathayibacter oskolensis]
MDFFPADPPQDESVAVESEPEPWRAPPENEVPALFPLSEVLAVAEDVAIIATGVRVYSTGVEFSIERRMRRGGMSEEEWQLAQMGFHGHHGVGSPGRMRYGLGLSDGQHLVLDRSWGGEQEPRDGSRHVLTMTGGSGGGSDRFHTSEEGLWLWPLPPEGPLELVVQWPDRGVPESRTVIDATSLRALAAEAAPIWP